MNDAIFSIVPIEAWRDKRLTLEQLRVLGVLLSFRSKTTNTVWPSRRQIADRCGMNVCNISTATTALERLGWLAKDGKGGHSKATRYTITVPDLEQSGTVAHSATVADGATVAHSATPPVADSATPPVAHSATRKEQTSEQTSEQTKNIAQSADRATLRNSTARDAFETFWQVFGHKKGKAKAEETFVREYAKANGSADWLEAVMAGAAKEAARRPHLIAAGSTPIYAQGWLTQRRYEDEDLLAWGEFSAEQQRFIDCFNANIGDTCPQVTEWTEKRAALADIALRGRWTLDRWAEFWRYVRDECEFGWPVSFEWMLDRENWAKTKGGQYQRGDA